MLNRWRRTLEQSRASALAAEPYLEMAREIGNRVTREMATSEPDAYDEVFANVLASVEQEEVLKQVAKYIQDQPIERILGVYATRVGDEAITEMLERRAQHEQRMFALKDEYKRTKQLDLSHTETGDMVELTLLGNAALNEASYCAMALRRKEDSPKGPLFQIMKDTIIRSALESRQSDLVGRVVRLGAYDVGSGEIEPVLCAGMSPTVYIEARRHRVELPMLADISVNDVQLEHSSVAFATLMRMSSPNNGK